MTQPMLREEMLVSNVRNAEIQVVSPTLASDGSLQRAVGDAVVIYLAGELDLDTAGELERRLETAVDGAGTGTVLIDLGRVDFIDAGSVGLIVQAWAAVRRRGGTLQVRCLRAIPARVFDVLGLWSTLVCPSEGDTYRRRSR